MKNGLEHKLFRFPVDCPFTALSVLFIIARYKHSIIFFKLKTFFQSSFKFTTKVERRSPMCSLPPHMQSPHYQHRRQSGTSVTTDGPTLTHHNPPKTVIYITVHFWCYMSLDQCMMTRIHR